jgi:hypothetical protein
VAPTSVTGMLSDTHDLWVPLRSNAHSLVAGAPVAAMRRRLKQAAVSYDHVLLEGGGLGITAGPDGWIEAPLPPEATNAFQTARQRHISPGQRFHLSLGTNEQNSSADPLMQEFINSETAAIWFPTLAPFAAELPKSVDWMRYASSSRSSAAKETADTWRRRDSRNETLQKVLPIAAVRDVVIRNADNDLAVAAHGGVSVMQDSRHQQVLGARFASESPWKATGFAVPMLMPAVGDLDWETVARIRSHRFMGDLRRILREIEHSVLEDARGGDAEAAVRHAMERHLVKAVGKVEGLGALPKHAIVELGVGTMIGVATFGLAGPVAVGTGAAAGAGVATVRAGVSRARAKRSKGWVTAYSDLHDSV